MAKEFKVTDEKERIEAVKAINALDLGRYRIAITKWQEKRGLTQNGLLQRWAREYAAHIWQIPIKEVSKGDHEGAKRGFKKAYYQMYGFKFMVYKVRDPLTGQEKMDFTSSSDWSTGEMYHFLTWLQMHAASNDCILESTGEFQKLKEKENETA